jgi:hypothetical protein
MSALERAALRHQPLHKPRLAHVTVPLEKLVVSRGGAMLKRA